MAKTANAGYLKRLKLHILTENSTEMSKNDTTTLKIIHLFGSYFAHNRTPRNPTPLFEGGFGAHDID